MTRPIPEDPMTDAVAQHRPISPYQHTVALVAATLLAHESVKKLSVDDAAVAIEYATTLVDLAGFVAVGPVTEPDEAVTEPEPATDGAPEPDVVPEPGITDGLEYESPVVPEPDAAGSATDTPVGPT